MGSFGGKKNLFSFQIKKKKPFFFLRTDESENENERSGLFIGGWAVGWGLGAGSWELGAGAYVCVMM